MSVETEGNNPDATVVVEVEGEQPESSGDVVVVVDNSGQESGDETADAVEEALTVERRFNALEERVGRLEERSWETPTVDTVVQIAEEAVAESAVVADVVAEETAAEVAEEVAEEVVEDTSPHKTHWLHRSWNEWLGKSGSGKVDKA